MTVPNIFDFATKELSQDAVICWLVAYAHGADGHHRQRGLDFVATLAGHSLDRPGGHRITEVAEPMLQYSRIDVYFQARVDGSLVSFVVEDKVGTRMHGDQLLQEGCPRRQAQGGPDPPGVLQDRLRLRRGTCGPRILAVLPLLQRRRLLVFGR